MYSSADVDVEGAQYLFRFAKQPQSKWCLCGIALQQQGAGSERALCKDIWSFGYSTVISCTPELTRNAIRHAATRTAILFLAVKAILQALLRFDLCS